MENRFEETLDEYLEGHLSYIEADKRLLGVKLDSEQAQIWQDLKPLDEGLAARTATRAELPWLVTKVTSRVDANQRAINWLKLQKHDPVGGFSIQYSQFFTPLVWRVLGAGSVGAFTGFWMGSKVAFFQQYQATFASVAPLPLLLAVGAGLLAALVVVSPSLRKYYS